MPTQDIPVRKLDCRMAYDTASNVTAAIMQYQDLADVADPLAHVNDPAANWPLVTDAIVYKRDGSLHMILKMAAAFTPQEDTIRAALQKHPVLFARQDAKSPTLVIEVDKEDTVMPVLDTLASHLGMPIALRKGCFRPLMSAEMYDLTLFHIVQLRPTL